jgi:hypothetical protein
MERRRFKQTRSLEERLSEEAKRLREEAKLLPPGAARDEMIRRARHAEIAAHMNEWLTSPGPSPTRIEMLTGRGTSKTRAR